MNKECVFALVLCWAILCLLTLPFIASIADTEQKREQQRQQAAAAKQRERQQAFADVHQQEIKLYKEKGEIERKWLCANVCEIFWSRVINWCQGNLVATLTWWLSCVTTAALANDVT